MTDQNRQEVRWAPRVPKWKVRRLYERVGQGIWDEELIVGDLEAVVRFLDELSGLPLPPDLRETERGWRRNYASTYWPEFLEKRREQTSGKRWVCP